MAQGIYPAHGPSLPHGPGYNPARDPTFPVAQGIYPARDPTFPVAQGIYPARGPYLPRGPGYIPCPWSLPSPWPRVYTLPMAPIQFNIQSITLDKPISDFKPFASKGRRPTKKV